MGNNIRWICENDDVEITTILNVESILGVKFLKIILKLQ